MLKKSSKAIIVRNITILMKKQHKWCNYKVCKQCNENWAKNLSMCKTAVQGKRCNYYLKNKLYYTYLKNILNLNQVSGLGCSVQRASRGNLVRKDQNLYFWQWCYRVRDKLRDFSQWYKINNCLNKYRKAISEIKLLPPINGSFEGNKVHRSIEYEMVQWSSYQSRKHNINKNI